MDLVHLGLQVLLYYLQFLVVPVILADLLYLEHQLLHEHLGFLEIQQVQKDLVDLGYPVILVLHVDLVVLQILVVQIVLFNEIFTFIKKYASCD